jgi:hypothetical protein
MAFFSDEALAIVVPILVYWVYSGMYMALGQSMDKYRLHPRKEEDSKNLVSKRDVVMGVLLQQLVQAAVAAVVFAVSLRYHSLVHPCMVVMNSLAIISSNILNFFFLYATPANGR